MPPPPQSSDRLRHQLLALRCQRGDPHAWQALIAAWEPRLLYYIARLVPQESDAWDILQQVWLGVFRNIHTLGDVSQLAPWLYRIARNKAIDLRRLRLPEPSDTIETTLTEDADPESDLDNAQAVHHALTHLSLPHREILTLFFLHDLSLLDIASVLNIPEGTVKSRLHHAKRALRQILSKELTQ